MFNLWARKDVTMLPLKFRAWDKEAKKMVTQFVLAPTTPTWGAFPIEEPDEQLLVGLRNYEYRTLPGPLSGTGQYTLTDWSNYHGLMNYEIMQWTGLVDKNGKDIFQGDIVAFKDYTDAIHAEVVWYDCGWAYGPKDWHVPYRAYLLHNRIEVIGNVWENSELLNDA
jgi:hypothetical protein